MEQMKRPAPVYLEIGEQAFAFDGDTLSFMVTPRGEARIPEDVFIVDVYALDDHTHPRGHLGWWECPIQDNAPLHVHMARTDGTLHVAVNGAPVRSFWRNDAFRPERRVLAMHLVVRAWRSTAIVFNDVVAVHPDRASLEAARSAAPAASVPDGAPVRWFAWPRERRVLLVVDSLRSAGVRGFCHQAVALLRANGIPCRVFAHEYGATDRMGLFPAEYVCHETRRDDVLLYVLADGCTLLPMVAELECRKFLYHLELPDWKRYQAFDAEFARKLRAAEEEVGLLARFDGLCFECGHTRHKVMAALRELTQKNLVAHWDAIRIPDGVERLAADPASGTPPLRLRTIVCVAGEPQQGEGEPSGAAVPAVPPQARPGTPLPRNMILKLVEPELPPTLGIFPPVLWQKNWDEVREEPCATPDRFLLSVGSFRPDKRYEDVLGIFAAVAEREPEMGLVIAGWPSVNGYWDYIRFLREHTYAALAPRIVLLQNAGNGQLLFLYRHAELFLSAGVHEGYSGSLSSAVRFGLPVVARRTAAVRRILGRTGLQFDAQETHDVVVEDIVSLCNDYVFRNNVLRNQQKYGNNKCYIDSMYNLMDILYEMVCIKKNNYIG